MGEEELVFIEGVTTGIGQAQGMGKEMEVDLGGVGGGEVNMTRILCMEFLKNW